MIPILFVSTETDFSSYGVGALPDAIICFPEENRNGLYEVTMEYPITGIHYADIKLRSIIKASANYIDDPQPFRVYKITKPINGKVTIYARHLSYDLSGVPVQPFTAAGIQSALNGLKANAMIDISRWTFTTSRTTPSNFKVDVPSSVRSWFGGKEGSLLDVYGGEWHYDGYTCSLENSRGTDRGVVIRYGVNLTDLKQEENCADVYTGVLAYWQDTDGNVVQGTIQNAPGTYDFTRIYTLDCSQDYEEAPTAAQLDAKAAAYITNNNIGIPKVNLTLNFAMLEGLLNRVDLCDTVTVVFEKLGVEAKAKCIRVKWNTLLDRYEEVELGDPKSELTEAILRANTEAAAAVKTANQTKNILDSEIETAVERVTGNLGGYIVLHDANDDGYPDELLIMNTPDIETATNVWRWNQQGLMHASSYAGTYTNAAITMDGQIVADAITTGILRGIEIISQFGSKIVDIVDGKVKSSGPVIYEGGPTTYTTSVVMDAGSLNLYDVDNDLLARLTSTGTNADGPQSGYFFICDKSGQILGLMTSTAVGNGRGGQLFLKNSDNENQVWWGAAASGGQGALYRADGSIHTLFGFLTLPGLMDAEPCAIFYNADGSAGSWYAGNRAYIRDHSNSDNTKWNEGYVVHGQTAAHGITVDFTAAGRIDFYVDTIYVGYASLSSSDKKTKKSIKPIAQKYKDAVASVDLKSFRFNFKDKVLSGANDLLRFGVIAQDVIKALETKGIEPAESELVDSVGEGDEERYVINYIPFLIARIAADEDRIKALEDKNTELGKRLAALESRLEAK